MTSQDIPKEVLAALHVHEAFRRLGFSADDIYVHCHSDGRVCVVLEAQEKTFAIDIAGGISNVSGIDPAEFESEWRKWSAEVNSNAGLAEELGAAFPTSEVMRSIGAVTLIQAMMAKGFLIPKFEGAGKDA